MKHLITHVLEGIQADRKEQLAAVEDRHAAACGKVADLHQRLADAPNQVVDFLENQATKLRAIGTFDRQQVELVRTDLLRLERSIPTSYDLGQAGKDVDYRQSRLDDLQAEYLGQDTQLEQFLRALLTGGETHVSQHALKQAGFDLKPITTYILARARAQTSQEG